MLILILALSVIITRFQCLSSLLWLLCLGTFSHSIFGISLLFLWESSRNWTAGMHIGRLYYWAMSPVCHGLSWVTLYLRAVFTGIFILTKYLVQRFWVINLKNSPCVQKASDREAHQHNYHSSQRGVSELRCAVSATSELTSCVLVCWHMSTQQIHVNTLSI